MLRGIKFPYIQPRMIANKLTIVSNSPVLPVAPEDASSFVDNSAGDIEIILRDPFATVPFVFATAGTNVGAGAIAGFGTDTANTEIHLTSATNAGVDADGDIHFIAIGRDIAQDEPSVPNWHTLKSSRIRHRIIGFNVDGTGTASLLSSKRQATLTDNDTGDYTLTFTNAFSQAPIAVGMIKGTTAGVLNIESVSNNSVRVKTFNAAGSATDHDFYLIVVGQDSTDTSGLHRRTAQTVHLKPRLELFKTSTDLSSITLGSERGTITDGGTGIFTITFTTPFKRAPEVMVTSAYATIVTVETVSTTQVKCRVFNDAGAAADSACHVLVLGYDDTAEQ